MSPWARYALVGVAGVVLGVVVAKYTLPPRVVEKVEIRTETVEVVKWKERVVVEQGPSRIITKTVTVPGPEGPTVTVEKIVEKDKIVYVRDGSGQQSTATSTEEKKEKTTDARAWLAVEGSVLFSINGDIGYSGGGQIRALGPIWVGVQVVKASDVYLGPSLRWEF